MLRQRRHLGLFAAVMLALSLFFTGGTAAAQRGSAKTTTTAAKKRDGHIAKRRAVRRSMVRSRKARLGKARGGPKAGAKLSMRLSRRMRAKARQKNRRAPEQAFLRAMNVARSASKLILDVGGEGAHEGAINVNPGSLTSTTGSPGRPIPNLVNGTVENIPFKKSSAAVIIVENAPLRSGATAELRRVISRGGTIKLFHPSEYAAQTHKSVIDAIGGTVAQHTANGVTTTVIVAP